MKKITTLLIACFALIFATSCTVQKSKQNNYGPIKKVYHDMNSHYNGYYNATVLVDESIVSLNDQNQDNYAKILPVYEYVASTNAQAAAPELDKAIKKVTVVVNLHPNSHWADDCYLLAGKAQYIKKEYESAEETFAYMLKEFSPEAIKERAEKGILRGGNQGLEGKSSRTTKKKPKSKKQRKKELKKKRKANKKRIEQQRKEREKRRKSGKNVKKSTKKNSESVKSDELPKTVVEGKKEDKKGKKTEKPDKYILKHRPAFQEGQLWMARTYIEREMYDDAERFISLLEKDPKTFKYIRRELAPVKAHFYLKQKKYEEAIEPLKLAIELAKDKELRARYSYILGQLYQQKGDSGASAIAFNQALKWSNNYDMEFSSKLNLVKSDWIAGKISNTEAESRLLKMTKDGKNREYRDQIYYLMSNVALKDNNRVAGISYLKSSLMYNENNQAQKTESYLKLAELYFADEAFVDAKNYYDSTLLALAPTDERYPVINEYVGNLRGIAESLTTIALQDSLLAVSKMSPEDQKALAYQLQKEENQRALEKIKSDAKNASADSRSNRSSRNVKSTYWAYNEKLRKKALKDFRKRWGDRPLADNWRLSKEDDFGIEDSDETDIAESVLTDEDVNRILKDVPKSEQEVKAAEGKIADAMLMLGTLYKDRLDNVNKSVETLADLEKRFPESNKLMEAYYYLYLGHTDLNNTAKAKIYRDKLLAKYPDSKYALALSDPNYLTQNKSEEQKLVDFYDETFDLYEKGNYNGATARIAEARKKFGLKNKLNARFELLNAMCMGSIEGVESYKNGLRVVIGTYPDTPEATKAKEILRLLNGGKGIDNSKDVAANSKDARKDRSKKAKYKVESDKLHYFIVMITGGEDLNSQDAKVAISDYNKKYHSLLKLRVSPVSLKGKQLIVLRRFKNQEKAMVYYDGLMQNKGDFLPEGVEYSAYPISQGNYRVILKNKSLEGYKEFFEANYQ